MWFKQLVTVKQQNPQQHLRTETINLTWNPVIINNLECISMQDVEDQTTKTIRPAR